MFINNAYYQLSFLVHISHWTKSPLFHCSESRMWWRVSQDRLLLHSFLQNSPATFWLHMGSSINSNQISHSHCSWSPSMVQLEDFTRTVSSSLSTTEIKPMWLPNRRASMPCGMTDRPHCFPGLLLCGNREQQQKR